MDTKEILLAILQSNARIELLIQTYLKSQFGEKETQRVYKEVCDLIDKEVKIEKC